MCRCTLHGCVCHVCYDILGRCRYLHLFTLTDSIQTAVTGVFGRLFKPQQQLSCSHWKSVLCMGMAHGSICASAHTWDGANKLLDGKGFGCTNKKLETALMPA